MKVLTGPPYFLLFNPFHLTYNHSRQPEGDWLASHVQFVNASWDFIQRQRQDFISSLSTMMIIKGVFHSVLVSSVSQVPCAPKNPHVQQHYCQQQRSATSASPSLGETPSACPAPGGPCLLLLPVQHQVPPYVIHPLWTKVMRALKIIFNQILYEMSPHWDEMLPYSFGNSPPPPFGPHFRRKRGWSGFGEMLKKNYVWKQSKHFPDWISLARLPLTRPTGKALLLLAAPATMTSQSRWWW